MRLGLRAAALAGFSIMLASSGSGRAANERVHGCMSPAQAREVLIVQKFVAPFRALGEAAAGQGGEAVGLQLCLWGDIFVYDVTVLKRDGRVSHALIDARSGVVATLPRAGK
ncbi:hypothetical protein P7D22_22690 [Lichenihabitans sp. Uapishka_5]|uniref:PepSY domain-containing protein n=1 Tax=Lichenihabitans sp. Uapishka_5 TaxID=3037302 RepID=UPI0029E80947|nr:hypothetical protein [Lichenihabitans sp. Uapishka_5]MDX7953964.1 hypothetical protein [Lichenihabitans sp. Uapishka_5]